MEEKDICYCFRVRVKCNNGMHRNEVYRVSEKPGRLGEAIATGKCCRYYEQLIGRKAIKDYRITAD